MQPHKTYIGSEPYIVLVPVLKFMGRSQVVDYDPCLNCIKFSANDAAIVLSSTCNDMWLFEGGV